MPGQPVPGVGLSNAQIMIVGEALGEDEALLEEPFVGRCGKLLTQMLMDAGITRDETYITNVVKCRPVKKDGWKVSNRSPTKEEVCFCKKWLWDELTSVTPRCILTLGKVPTSTLIPQLKKTFTLGPLVGVEHRVDYTDAVIIPLYHPSYLMVHAQKKIDETIDLFRKIREQYA
jgi:uracil-DNA glycosylase family 4